MNKFKNILTMKAYHLIYVAGLLAMTACSELEDQAHSQEPVDVRLTATPHDGLSFGDRLSRAADGLYTASSGFDGGETVKVYMDSDDESADFTVDTETPTALTGTLYYPATGDVTLYAVYPAASVAQHTVAYDQSQDAAYKASDLMFAKKDVAQADKENSQNLEFKHQLVKLKLKVTKSEGVSAITRITLDNVKRQVSVTPSQSELTLGTPETAADELGDGILVYDGSMTSTEQQTYAVVFPAQQWQDDDFVTITANGKTDTCKLTKDDFTAGDEYTVSIAVSASSLGTTATITSWENGGQATIAGVSNTNKFSITAIPAQTYTGEAIEPAVTVKDGETTLNRGSQYVVAYKNNVNAGTASVTVMGLTGIYAGEVATIDFTIGKATPVITISTDDMEITVGKTDQRSASSTFGSVTFTSADENIATVSTVSDQATVTAVSEGSTTITASVAESDNWYAAESVSFAVTVSAASSGFINGQFTINSSGDKVYFSKGNLQLVGADTWQVAENQWDCFGTSQSDNHRDLFGWGTKSNPNNTSQTDSEYSWNEWGENTSLVSSLGSGWRTLTSEEWTYVFNTRTTTSNIRYAKATVNNMAGVILLPDDWNASYYSLSSTNTADAAFTTNKISSDDWTSSFEAHGAVFLPAAGYRYGSSVINVSSHGFYWSATASVRKISFPRTPAVGTGGSRCV